MPGACMVALGWNSRPSWRLSQTERNPRCRRRGFAPTGPLCHPSAVTHANRARRVFSLPICVQQHRARPTVISLSAVTMGPGVHQPRPSREQGGVRGLTSRVQRLRHPRRAREAAHLPVPPARPPQAHAPPMQPPASRPDRRATACCSCALLRRGGARLQTGRAHSARAPPLDPPPARGPCYRPAWQRGPQSLPRTAGSCCPRFGSAGAPGMRERHASGSAAREAVYGLFGRFAHTYHRYDFPQSAQAPSSRPLGPIAAPPCCAADL
jgi:hypothetical protein